MNEEKKKKKLTRTTKNGGMSDGEGKVRGIRRYRDFSDSGKDNLRVHHMLPSFRSHIFARTMKVIPVPVREDNYAYLLVDERSKKAAAVDPYDVPKVATAAEAHGVEIVAGLTTHHHFDHSGGNKVRANDFRGSSHYS